MRRTSLINQMRGFLLERGIAVAQGPKNLQRRLPEILADDGNHLSPRMRRLVEEMGNEQRVLDKQIAEIDVELATIGREDDACRRLQEVPGIGPLIATALVAAVGNGAAFAKGRDMAAWLGLTPREYTTGGRQRLLGISKRGNKYLRTQLIHGARGALASLMKRQDAMGQWLARLLSRGHRNVAVVALANKLARIAWAVLSGARRFEPSSAT